MAKRCCARPPTRPASPSAAEAGRRAASAAQGRSRSGPGQVREAGRRCADKHRDAGAAPHRAAADAALGSRQEDRELLDDAAGARARHHLAHREDRARAAMGSDLPDDAAVNRRRAGAAAVAAMARSARLPVSRAFTWCSARAARSPTRFSLDAFVDDRPENCLDIAVESKAKVILVWHGDLKDVPRGREAPRRAAGHDDLRGDGAARTARRHPQPAGHHAIDQARIRARRHRRTLTSAAPPGWSERKS